jgi:DNA-binding NarL/FixJ family response regulator
MGDEPEYKKRCPAMIQAGIDDPTSPEGAQFCTGECPYPYCVVFDSPPPREQLAQWRSSIAKDLKARGVSTKDIALIFGKDTRTVQRYLKR